VRPDRREGTLVASRPVWGTRRSTSISCYAQVFFTQSLLRPVGYRTAGADAKLPFAGILLLVEQRKTYAQLEVFRL
jgi:hypothetical protein